METPGTLIGWASRQSPAAFCHRSHCKPYVKKKGTRHIHSRDQYAFTLSFIRTKERVGRAFHKTERDWQKKMTPIFFLYQFPCVSKAEGGEVFVCQKIYVYFFVNGKKEPVMCRMLFKYDEVRMHIRVHTLLYFHWSEI
jgi:hypothetical protein